MDKGYIYRQSIAIYNHKEDILFLFQKPISLDQIHYKMVIKVESLVTKLTIDAYFIIKQFVV